MPSSAATFRAVVNCLRPSAGRRSSSPWERSSSCLESVTSPSESDPRTIAVDDVSVHYRSVVSDQTWRGVTHRLFQRDKAVRIVPALQHVSVDVPTGAVLGVIGA